MTCWSVSSRSSTKASARPPPVGRDPRRDERAQVQALVDAGLLALHVREAHVPAVQDEPRELALLGGDQHRARPARPRGGAARRACRRARGARASPPRSVGDPLAPHPSSGLAERGRSARGPLAGPAADDLVAHALPAARGSPRAAGPARSRGAGPASPTRSGSPGAARAKASKWSARRHRLRRPHRGVRAPARLEVLAHAVAADAVEVERQDVRDDHGTTPG